MKIKTKFDLLRKVKHSKEGISGNEIFFKDLKPLFLMHISNFIFFIDHLIKRNIFGVTINVVFYSFIFGVSNLKSKIFKQEDINNAEIDLQQLVNELSKLEVKTSVELLQEAKVNQIDYKIKYEDDDKIPRLVQYKYIDVPLVSGYEETLLQEHKYGDKDYELSVNSPVKKMNYKVAKINI